MPSPRRFASHGSRAALLLLLLPLLYIHQSLARVAFITSLSAETYHLPNSTTPALKLTCAIEGNSNDSVRIDWLKAGMDRLYEPSSQPADVYNVTSAAGSVMVISTILLSGAQISAQSIRFVQCSDGAGLNSSTLLKNAVLGTPGPCDSGGGSSTQSSGCTCAPCYSPASTDSRQTPAATSQPRATIGDETVFWSVVGAGALGWLLCLLFLVCSRCCSSGGGDGGKAPTAPSPRQQQPNNLRSSRVPASARREEQRRRHEAVEVRRRSAQDLMHAGDSTDDGTLFTNPLFESDSMTRQQQQRVQQQQQQHQQQQRVQQQQQPQQQQQHPQQSNMLRRPPLPLPSVMDDPAAAWPHAQSPLSASASQPHLHNSLPDLPLLPPSLPRPGGLSVDTRPQAPLPTLAARETPPKTMPRSISAEPKPLVSPTRPVPPQGLELGLGRPTSQLQDVQPPAIPTTQRPTLPRPTRSSIDLTHDLASPSQASVQLPLHTVDDFNDYLTPSSEADGGGWSSQFSAVHLQAGPKEYIILADRDAVADGAVIDGAYMDTVGVQSSMPQSPMHNLPASTFSDTERLIEARKRAVDMPRRTRRPSSPSGAPQFRKSKSKI